MPCAQPRKLRTRKRSDSNSSKKKGEGREDSSSSKEVVESEEEDPYAWAEHYLDFGQEIEDAGL